MSEIKTKEKYMKDKSKNIYKDIMKGSLLKQKNKRAEDSPKPKQRERWKRLRRFLRIHCIRRGNVQFLKTEHIPKKIRRLKILQSRKNPTLVQNIKREECYTELDEKIEDIKNSVAYDEFYQSGESADWNEVAAVFAVKIGSGDNPEDAVVFDEAKKEKL